MKLLQLTTFLLLSVGVLPQTVSAGPFEGIRNFFNRRQEQPEHPVHRHIHKDAKEAPNGSPSPVAPAVDQQPNGQQTNSQQPNGQQPNGQQPNGSPVQQNTLNTASTLIITNTNRTGRPNIASAVTLAGYDIDAYEARVVINNSDEVPSSIP